jgi:hypothetical protein
MGLLVGLPLGIFRLLAGLVMLILRLAVPILLVAVIVLLLRRRRSGAPGREAPKEPHFDGPVYTVDYQEEDSEEEGQ